MFTANNFKTQLQNPPSGGRGALIKNGRIITASDDYVADILIEGETIKAIGKDMAVDVDETIDATGMLIFPGGIDPHVHLEMPFMGTFSSDTYETGFDYSSHVKNYELRIMNYEL